MYGRRDEPFARALADIVQAAGWDVWLDVRRTPPPDALRDAIEGGISASDTVLWVASPDTPMTYWTCMELSWAVEHRVPVVAVSPDDLHNGSLPWLHHPARP